MKLQWIRPDWPVCLLGHEAFKRPTCRALSCLSVIWVKLFLMHRCCYRPWPKSNGSTLFSRVCAATDLLSADIPAPGYLPSSLRPHCTDIAGGQHTCSRWRRRGKAVLRAGAQTNYQGNASDTKCRRRGGSTCARVCVHVRGHAGGWKTKCCWGDNAQRRKESARRELHY